MARTKVYTIKISDEQQEKLKKALRTGSPLTVALAYARIPATQYYYYVEVANISWYFKNLELTKEEESVIHSGITLSDVEKEAKALNTHKVNTNGAINIYKEPNAESILRYKNNRTFKEFCDKVYEFINECDNLRSEAVLYHLTAIHQSVGKKGVNTSASQWFLERTIPEHFGKTEKVTQRIEGDIHQTFSGDDELGEALPPIKVEFVDPNTKESKDRVKDMEDLVRDQLGKGMV